MIYVLPGDFFSTRGKGLTGWANEHLTKTPAGCHTDRFHFGVIADPIFDEENRFLDFETRESISKGPSTLRFFEQYRGQDIEIYRLTDLTPSESIRLVRSISKIGRDGYGYKDFLQAFADIFCLLITLQFPPYLARQLKVSANPNYICTEIPAYGARQIGRPVEAPDAPDVWDIPVVYLQAIEEGRLKMVYKGDLRELYREMMAAQQLKIIIREYAKYD